MYQAKEPPFYWEPPEFHEIDECKDCHFAELHEPEDWQDLCYLCEKMIEEINQREEL